MPRRVGLDTGEFHYQIYLALPGDAYRRLEPQSVAQARRAMKICAERGIETFRSAYFQAVDVESENLLRCEEMSDYTGVFRTRAFLTVMHAVFLAVEKLVGSEISNIPWMSQHRRFHWPEEQYFPGAREHDPYSRRHNLPVDNRDSFDEDEDGV